MATIKDIAKLTGVSVATVSNVLNGKAGAASKEKIDAILAAAKQLEYTPNTFAKTLKLKKSKTIGIITEDLTVFNTPEIVNGIEEYCEEQGYEIVLSNMRLFKRYNNNLTDTPEHFALFDNIMHNLVGKHVEGIVYVGYHCRKVSYMPKTDIPFVYAYCLPDDLRHPYVLFDDENAAYNIGYTLIENGHKNIGVISGPLSSLNAQARLRGFQRALFEKGILYNAETTFFGDWTRDSGYINAQKLLNMGVTAIFAMNDVMASGVYAYCMDNNLTVGKDISIFGYDNISDLVQAFSPPISSVESPLNEMGRKSAELVFSQIKNENIPKNEFMLPAKLHVTKSIAPYTSK